MQIMLHNIQKQVNSRAVGLNKSFSNSDMISGAICLKSSALFADISLEQIQVLRQNVVTSANRKTTKFYDTKCKATLRECKQLIKKKASEYWNNRFLEQGISITRQ